MPDGLPDLWRGYAPDMPEMPTMPWGVVTQSGSCWRFLVKDRFKFNTSPAHHNNILRSVGIQTRSCGQIVSSSGILSVSLRSPNNGCSNLLQDTNARRQLGVRWSTLMSGTPSLALGLEDRFLPWQICCWWHFSLSQGANRWMHEILNVQSYKKGSSIFFSTCRPSLFQNR